MKFCANLSFLFTTETASIIERYALAKDAGFKAVETGFPVGFSLEDITKAKNESGLHQVLINLYTGDVTKGEVGITAVPGKEDDFRKNLEMTINYAKALKCSKIHVMAGKVDNPNDKNWETYESNLRFAADRFSTENIVGLIEPINPYSVPKYLLNNYERGVEILKKVNSPHLKLMLDIFHLQHIKGDITNSIKTLMPHVGHVQIAQLPFRDEPGNNGEINYSYILNLLKEVGYEDWVGLEYKPKDLTKPGLQWIKELGYSL